MWDVTTNEYGYNSEGLLKIVLTATMKADMIADRYFEGIEPLEINKDDAYKPRDLRGSTLIFNKKQELKLMENIKKYCGTFSNTEYFLFESAYVCEGYCRVFPDEIESTSDTRMVDSSNQYKGLYQNKFNNRYWTIPVGDMVASKCGLLTMEEYSDETHSNGIRIYTTTCRGTNSLSRDDIDACRINERRSKERLMTNKDNKYEYLGDGLKLTITTEQAADMHNDGYFEGMWSYSSGYHDQKKVKDGYYNGVFSTWKGQFSNIYNYNEAAKLYGDINYGLVIVLDKREKEQLLENIGKNCTNMVWSEQLFRDEYPCEGYCAISNSAPEGTNWFTSCTKAPHNKYSNGKTMLIAVGSSIANKCRNPRDSELEGIYRYCDSTNSLSYYGGFNSCETSYKDPHYYQGCPGYDVDNDDYKWDYQRT